MPSSCTQWGWLFCKYLTTSYFSGASVKVSRYANAFSGGSWNIQPAAAACERTRRTRHFSVPSGLQPGPAPPPAAAPARCAARPQPKTACIPHSAAAEDAAAAQLSAAQPAPPPAPRHYGPALPDAVLQRLLLLCGFVLGVVPALVGDALRVSRAISASCSFVHWGLSTPSLIGQAMLAAQRADAPAAGAVQPLVFLIAVLPPLIGLMVRRALALCALISQPSHRRRRGASR